MEQLERDYYIDSQIQLMIDFSLSWKKEIKLEKLEIFLKNYRYIKNIKVIGHSMSDVDMEYMEIIEKTLNPEIWYILQHNGNPSLEDLSEYSFKNKVQFMKLNNGKLSVLK